MGIYVYFDNSGSPLSDVKIESIPAVIDELITIFQFISLIIADVPIVAAAVCETVFIARIIAAFSHFLDIIFILFYPLKSRLLCLELRSNCIRGHSSVAFVHFRFRKDLLLLLVRPLRPTSL